MKVLNVRIAALLASVLKRPDDWHVLATNRVQLTGAGDRVNVFVENETAGFTGDFAGSANNISEDVNPAKQYVAKTSQYVRRGDLLIGYVNLLATDNVLTLAQTLCDYFEVVHDTTTAGHGWFIGTSKVQKTDFDDPIGDAINDPSNAAVYSFENVRGTYRNLQFRGGIPFEQESVSLAKPSMANHGKPSQAAILRKYGVK